MQKLWTATVVLVAVTLIGGAAAVRSERGTAFRDQLYTNRHCCDLSFLDALNVTIQEARGTFFPSHAELEALKGTDLSKYRFGAMAIEHNEAEPKRTETINYLRQYGYERVHTYQQDDFFVPISR